MFYGFCRKSKAIKLHQSLLLSMMKKGKKIIFRFGFKFSVKNCCKRLINLDMTGELRGGKVGEEMEHSKSS